MGSPDDFVALIEDDEPRVAAPAARWKVAVIDDDRAVHDGTRFALYDYALNGQRLEIVSAFSAAEGRELLRQNPDLAVVLLDVVMETDEAGLDLVSFIRDELKNETVRIILRTGQPGQAPERRVIVEYDINDYKAKTELTADKLFTTLTAALRSYSQLQRMVETRRGLEIIIEAASTLFDFRSMQRLAEGVLTQMASLLNADCAGVLVLRDERHPQESFAVLAGSGCYSRFAGSGEVPTLDPHLLALIGGAFERRCHDFCDERSVIYLQTGSGREVVVLLESPECLSETDRALVEVFCSRLSIAFDNVLLYQQLQDANASLEERVTQRTAELTAANERLATQWRRLREANRFKGEILGTVAHDLKNPLGVIMGRAEMLTDLLGLQPPALDISIRSQTIDLVALVDRVVEANRPLAERKDQVVEVRKPEALVATGDPDRLQEAVDNLVSNAVKYGPVGSAITIAVEARGDRNAVAVRDAGPGLSPEDIARLFGRFQRLSAKPTAG